MPALGHLGIGVRPASYLGEAAVAQQLSLDFFSPAEPSFRCQISMSSDASAGVKLSVRTSLSPQKGVVKIAAEMT